MRSKASSIPVAVSVLSVPQRERMAPWRGCYGHGGEAYRV